MNTTPEIDLKKENDVSVNPVATDNTVNVNDKKVEEYGGTGEETFTVDRDKLSLQPEVAALFAPKESKLLSNLKKKANQNKPVTTAKPASAEAAKEKITHSLTGKLVESSKKPAEAPNVEKPNVEKPSKPETSDDEKPKVEEPSKQETPDVEKPMVETVEDKNVEKEKIIPEPIVKPAPSDESFNAEVILDSNSLKNIHKVISKQATIGNLVGVIASNKLHLKGKINENSNNNDEENIIIDLTVDSDIVSAEGLLLQVEGIEDIKILSSTKLQFTFNGNIDVISWLLNYLTTNDIPVRWFTRYDPNKSILDNINIKPW